MDKIKDFRIVFAVFFISITGYIGCTNPPPKPPPTKPINVIVILDTSDRISKDKNPHQAGKDIAIAEGIVNLFEEKLVRPELYINYPHRLAFVVPEQIGVDPIPLNITEDTGGGAPQFKKKKTELLKEIRHLYASVEKQGKFTGSDIWDWFRGNAEAYLQQDALNYIICVSDGYLDFDSDIQKNRPRRGNKTTFMRVAKFHNNPNWEKKFANEEHGLLEIGKDFSRYKVKFLMVEIKLRHILDRPILEKYWQTWLVSMGITHSEFWEDQNDPDIVIGKIKEFILPKKQSKTGTPK